jgi:antitoxin (DNA-binding transcriptional repressor) of toxin-antitoxin stability system
MTERIHVTMREAKARLCELAERVWHGDKVVIIKAGKPYVDMLPEVDTPRVSKLGHGKLGCLRIFDKSFRE